jgi:hypothetical protein
MPRGLLRLVRRLLKPATNSEENMPLNVEEIEAILRARAIGARTAAAIAALTGAVLVALTLDEPQTVPSTLAATLVVMAAAWVVGRRVGERIAGGGTWRALAWGIMGGIACLLVAAVAEGMIVGVRGLCNGAVRDSADLLSTAFNTTLIIAMCGAIFAVALGAAGGLVIRYAVTSRSAQLRAQ